MTKVLICEDSPVFQKILKMLLHNVDNIEIVDIVDNGLDAVEKCKTLKPDLVTMDIFMPKLNGLEATRRIMAECPTRIVIISSMINTNDLKYSFEAIQAGAIEVIEKPTDIMSGKYEKVRDALVSVIKRTMAAEPSKRFTWLTEAPWQNSEIETRQSAILSAALGAENLEMGKMPIVIPVDYFPRIICIGGSTGAPAVISDILRCLPDNFRIPIIIAQHIVKGFVKGMTDWLNSVTKLTVKIADNGEIPPYGHVLFAPDGMNIEFTDDRRIILVPGGPKDIYVPSINALFHSSAKIFRKQALGILLSGMGKDGAEGLLDMRKQGAITIGQSEETSVIYGMSKVAASLGAVMEEMSPSAIAELLGHFSECFNTRIPM